MIRRRRSSLAGLVACTVIVNLKSDTDRALRGVLLPAHPDLVRLANVALHDHGQVVQVDGETVVPLSNVEFLQIISPTDGSP